MVVVLSGLGRVPLWDRYDEVFNPGPVGLREAHHALAVHAVDEQWDETVVVVQDDVEAVPVGDHHGDITSYWPSFTGQWGWMRHPDHVCPKVFTATPTGWQQLAVVWAQEGQTCELWTPDYVTVGSDNVMPGKRRKPR